MERKKLYLKYPVVVEGKYDKIKISSIVDSTILQLDGYSSFNDPEKLEYLRKMSKSTGIILLTDSDRAGTFIRSKLKGYINGNIINVYAPQVKGREKRKTSDSKDGLLGIEGTDINILYELLKPYEGNCKPDIYLTTAQAYNDGLYGSDNSLELRKKLAKRLSLPDNLSAKALFRAVCQAVNRDEYITMMKEIKENNE